MSGSIEVIEKKEQVRVFKHIRCLYPNGHPMGPRRKRREKNRMNNKKHTKCRIKNGLYSCNNVRHRGRRLWGAHISQ